MMGLNFVDESGQPRSDQDLQEAIDTVVKEMVSRTPGNPQLIVMFPTIIECLQELQGLRRVISEHAEKKRTTPSGG